MPLLGKHEVVGDADGDCLGKDNVVSEKGVERAEAADVKVEIDTTKVVEDEVPDSVCTLDGVGVAIEGLEEPGVILSNELASTGIGPEFVFVVWHHIATALGDIRPLWRKSLRLPRLMKYPRDTLFLTMLGGIPTVSGERSVELFLCDVGGEVDLEIVGYGGEDDDSAH